MTSTTLRNGGEHALAAVARGVAVAQLDGLVRAGAGTARNAGDARRAAGEAGAHLERGVAARVEHLEGVEPGDGAVGAALTAAPA